MPHQVNDPDLINVDDTYTIKKEKNAYLLKKITIEKDALQYAFIGGMWYTNDKFSFQHDISLPYPFSTYYTIKILDKTYNDQQYRSLVYVKTPLLVIQQKKSCIAITFDPCININDKDIFPFIGLQENKTSFVISFYLFPTYDIKTKNSEWLGRGEKKSIHHTFRKNDSFSFFIELNSFKNWEEAVVHFFNDNKKKDLVAGNPTTIFYQAKKALYRSYDHKTGSFLQLPWKTSTGFTFQNSSYSLMSYEAVRLDYFSRWYKKTKDQQFFDWGQELKNHFINPDLNTSPSKKGKGLIWYNMTNLTKKGLKGYFYMDCGYAGYPGGQASIAYHILQYLEEQKKNKKLEKNLKKSLQYLISTQHKDGSWPMAIKQEGFIRLRREHMEKYISSGGTGESARALFAAAHYFNNKTYRKQAEKALSFLKTNVPICYNGLRDIGIMEPEAFSAVSVIHAFLDGYDQTKKEEYLNQAFTYAHYLLPWLYMYDTSTWKMKHNFHPISYSITPRLSPYETVWVVSLFNRLASYKNHDFWSQLAINCYNAVLPWISFTGGLSEGVFPHYHKDCKPLPMEQTFATVELMNASHHYMNELKDELKERKNEKQNQKKIVLDVDDGWLHIKYKNRIICKVNAASCSITEIVGKKIGTYGITLSIQGPFSLKNKIKHKIIKQGRGSIGKYLLGVKDATYAITGVKAPKIRKKQIDLISNHINHSSINTKNKDQAIIKCHTAYHTITTSVQIGSTRETIDIIFNTTIKVTDHDVSTNSVLFPVINALIQKKTNQKILFDTFTLHGEFEKFVTIDNFTGVDQTLKTNWTHGGIFCTSLKITIPSNLMK